MSLTKWAKYYDKEFKKKTRGLKLQASGIHEEEIEDDPTRVPRLTNVREDLKDWRKWLTEGQFYLYGIVYMLVRIAVNVTMVRFGHNFIVCATILLDLCDWV